jgi:hypothetical protein
MALFLLASAGCAHGGGVEDASKARILRAGKMQVPQSKTWSDVITL